MAQLTTAKIVGSSSSATWSQTQILTWPDRVLMVVLQLSFSDSTSMLDLATLGAEMLGEVESKGERILTSDHLREMVASLTQDLSEGLSVKIITGLWQGETLILYGSGEVEAFLARGEHLARLCDSWGEGRSVEGKLQVGDTIVLSTSEFVAGVGLPKIKKILISDEAPAELLIPLVHTQTDSSGVAAIVGTVQAGRKDYLWTPLRLRLREPRKMNLWLGALMLFLLLMMIGVGMVRKARYEEARVIEALTISVMSKLDETTSVGDLNPERARQLLTQSSQEVTTYLASEPKSTDKLRAEQLLLAIAEAEEKAFKKNEVALTTVTELSVLSPNLSSTSMKGDGKESVLFLDEQDRAVISMHLVDRSRRLLETESEQIVDIAVGETSVYGVGTRGVFEYSWDKKPAIQVIEADPFWKDPALIELFAGNVYVFDRAQSEIWKYPTLGTTFGARRRWLAAGITPDLSHVVDMKVVGDIWLLTATGKLERYRQGAPLTFSLEGFPAQGEGKLLSEPKAMWVSDSLIYVLESGAARIVVFSDEGRYEAQYANSEFASASDFVVVDDRVYVLIDDAVKEFRL